MYETQEFSLKQKIGIVCLFILSICVLGLAIGLPFLFMDKPPYTVTWVDDEGKVLEVDKGLERNTMPHYDGPTPSKTADENWLYAFDSKKGWDKPLKPVTKSITYKVVFQKKEQNLVYEYDADTNGYSVNGFKAGYEGDDEAIIGATFKGTDQGDIKIGPVTEISSNAFNSNDEPNSTLKRVLIPDTIKVIGQYAFNNCQALETIEGSVEYSQLEHVGQGAFHSTQGPWLSHVVLPASIKEMEDSVFSHSAVKNITLPRQLTVLPNYTFSNCTQLEEVILPEVLTSMGDYVFNGTPLPKIDIPANVEQMGESVFRDCSALTSVTFGENSKLQTIGNDTFHSCTSLVEITLPDSLTSWGGTQVLDAGNTFYDCTSLQTIHVPNGTNYIPHSAFFNCTSLQSIYLPDNIVEIAEAAFQHSGLTSLYIPASVQKVGAYTVSFCPNLTEISSGVTNPGESNTPPGWDPSWMSSSNVTTVTWDQARP